MTQSADQMQLIVDSKNILGECSLWCERSGRLLWTDIQGAVLFAHTPATGATASFPMPDRLCSFALTAHDDRLLLGLATGLAFFDFSSAAITPICDVEPDLPSTRLNDGRCDRQGRFVFGTFNQDSNPRAPIGSFYRLNHDLSLEVLPLGPVAIANSICFSPDGATMYYADSAALAIRCCDYDGATGAVSNPRVFADLREGPGEPDGSAIDADGYLWNASWGASRINRYAPDGRLDRSLDLPASQPTCVAFGGRDYTTLFATSARVGLAEDELARLPGAGGVFATRVEVRGLPESRFGVREPT